MNREILFRGKRIDNGEWVEGYPCAGIGIDADKWFLLAVGRDWLNSHIYQVDPATIGQYTGLTDKNGKRIFEGDIVEGFDFCADDDGYGVVTWDDGGFIVSNAFLCGSFIENYNGRDFEVIGNIHDDRLEEDE